MSGVRCRCLARRPPPLAHETKECHRLWHAFQLMAAPLLGHEKTGDLPLHLRGNYDSAWLRQRLYPRRNVGGIAVNLARRINHHRAGFDADAGVEIRLAGTGILAIDLSERPLDREGGPRCAFGVVFLRHWIPKQRHYPITQLLGDVAAHLRHCCRGGVQIRADQITPVLGI